MITTKKKRAAAQEAARLRAEHTPEAFASGIITRIANLGFQQIMLPGVEDGKIYTKSQRLQDLFGPAVMDLGKREEFRDLIFSPTHAFSAMRKYLNMRKTHDLGVSKWFYFSPLTAFQKQRPVTTHELGIFVLGNSSPLAITQILNTVYEMLSGLNMPEFVFELNSLGCDNCRKDYQDILADHLAKENFSLCQSCKGKFAKNPFVIWNCENNVCNKMTVSVPQILDFLDENCKTDLMRLLEDIDELGIPYLLNPVFCKPLLTRNISFRVRLASGEETNLGEGGNYSAWAPDLGAQEDGAFVGFLSSLESLFSHVPKEGKKAYSGKIEVFTIPLGDTAARKIILLQRDIRKAGITVGDDMLNSNGIKAQLKTATDHSSEIALIIGQKEALDDTVILRDIRSGGQEVFSSDRIVDEVRKRLGK